MAGDVIQFPGPRSSEEISEEEVRTPVAIFVINEHGQVDLADGLSITDAVNAFWEAVQDTVREAWSDHPLGRERARTRLLAAYLDKVRPQWREELAWKV